MMKFMSNIYDLYSKMISSCACRCDKRTNYENLFDWLNQTKILSIFTIHSSLCLLSYGSRDINRPSVEVVAQRCFIKKFFLEILQNSQENTCANKQTPVKTPQPATLLKKKLWYRCFPVNFAKFLRTPFLTEHLRCLLLPVAKQLSGLNPLSLSNNKNYRLSRVFPFNKRKIAVRPTIHQNSPVSKVLLGKC